MTASEKSISALREAWQRLGSAAPLLLILARLPSVLAGIAAGWFIYLWLRDVADRTTAIIAMSLVLFSPALIYTSAEVRQYALLLCFMAATLYLLDRAFMTKSPKL